MAIQNAELVHGNSKTEIRRTQSQQKRVKIVTSITGMKKISPKRLAVARAYILLGPFYSKQWMNYISNLTLHLEFIHCPEGAAPLQNVYFFTY